MAKQKEIKIKYPESRIRALSSVLGKKNTVVEVELLECLNQLYRKNVKPEVREFIEEMEEYENPEVRKARSSIQKSSNLDT